MEIQCTYFHNKKGVAQCGVQGYGYMHRDAVQIHSDMHSLNPVCREAIFFFRTYDFQVRMKQSYCCTKLHPSYIIYILISRQITYMHACLDQASNVPLKNNNIKQNMGGGRKHLSSYFLLLFMFAYAYICLCLFSLQPLFYIFLYHPALVF